MKAYTSLNKNTPVTEPLIGLTPQITNNTGGFVYAISPWQQFERFLIMGSEGGTYYSSERKLTRDNAVNTIKCIESDGRRAVDLIVAISDAGRALKNDPALLALAIAASAKDSGTRSYALSVLPRVARIPTHLFHFAEFVQQFRGWGRGLRRAIAEWYQQQDVDRLAYGLVKYQQRDGWSNADLLRLSHPKTDDPIRNLVYSWAVDGLNLDKIEGAEVQNYKGPAIISAFEFAKRADVSTKKGIQFLIELIHTYNLSREMLPTEALTKPEIWEALLQRMPPHALIRNLGNLSKCGLLAPLSDAERLVVEKLSGDHAAQLFAKNRVHPIAILIAGKVYAQGKGVLGKGAWQVSQRVVDALDEAYYLAHKYSEPTNKRFLYGIDVSGSMGGGWSIHGPSVITPAEAAAAMALSIAKVEPEYAIYGFAHDFRHLGITPKMRLNDVLNITRINNFGSTDASLAMRFAREKKINVDVFVIITDNEVNTGKHPSQELDRYRQAAGIPAKLVVIACTPVNFSIADPNDPGMLDISGFDANIPQAVQEFAKL